jgi:hypothetical protein
VQAEDQLDEQNGSNAPHSAVLDHHGLPNEPQELQKCAVFVRTADGRCISVFPRCQDSFTVLKVTFSDAEFIFA